MALRPDGGDLVVRGRTLEGTWEQRLRVAPVDPGQGDAAAVTLFGREAVEDLETKLAAGGYARDIDATIEQIGVEFQIATRLTSWIAVSSEQTVDPSDPLRRQRVPHEVPYGVSAEGMGLRRAMPAAALAPASASSVDFSLEELAEAPERTRSAGVPSRPFAAEKKASIDMKARLGRTTDAGLEPPAPPPAFGSMPQGPQGAARQGATAGMPPTPAPPVAAPQVIGVAQSQPVRRSLFEKIKDVLTGGRRDEAGPAPSRRLRGRVALQSGELLVIEVSADGELPWAPAGEARITLASGQVVVARIDPARTTRNGTVAQGAAARLALVLPSGARLDGVKTIQIELDGETVLIEVG